MKKILLLLSVIITAGAWEVHADPLLFSNVTALQNEGSTRVALFSNPGTTLFGPQITFLVDITGSLPAGGMDTLLITYSETGSPVITRSFDIPLLGSVLPPVTLLFTITSFGASFQGTPAILTLDLLSSTPDFIIPSGPGAGLGINSFSYTFNVAEPVPEPATLTLLGAGLTGLLAQQRKLAKKPKEATTLFRAAASE